MISKKRLLEINGLNLSDIIDQMSTSQLTEYCKNLDDFVDKYPIYEAEMRQAFTAMDHTAFSHAAISLRNLLILLHADEMAQGCLKLLGDIKADRYDVTEAFFTYFLTALSALSIDIQITQNKGDQDEELAEKFAEPAAETNQNSSLNSNEKNILAVDDMPMILSGLKTVFQGTRYKFAGVASAAAALQYIQTHRPDIFLLDIEMPEMDGYELAARIRKNGHTAPIVFLTGNSSKEYVLKAMSAGAADFIVKPINREQVLGKVIKHTL